MSEKEDYQGTAFYLTAKFVVDCVLISLCGMVGCRSQLSSIGS